MVGILIEDVCEDESRAYVWCELNCAQGCKFLLPRRVRASSTVIVIPLFVTVIVARCATSINFVRAFSELTSRLTLTKFTPLRSVAK